MGVSPLLLGLGSALAATLGQVLMRYSQQLPDGGRIGGIPLSAAVLLSLLCHALAAVLWLVALGRAPLSRLYPVTVLTQILVPIAAWRWLGEPLSWRTAVAAALAGAAVLVLRG